MMDTAVKIIIVAMTVAFLGAWGIIKQQRKSQELISSLFKKSEKKVINRLKQNEKLSIKDVEKIIKGTKASLFWSKEQVQVSNPSIVAKELINNMKNKGLIVEEVTKSKKLYRLK